MQRILFALFLIGGFGLAGCGPGTDPLEWKLDASSPAALQEWLDARVALMPEELGREFAVCFSNIQVTLPPARTQEPLEKANHLCARLRDKTVRDVLIEGNEISYNMLVARAKNFSDGFLRQVNASDRMTDAQRERLIASGHAQQEELRRQIEQSEKRLAQLRAGAVR